MCPTRTPPWWPRWAWAASSSTSSPRSIHVAMCAGATTWPKRCTGTTALVRGVSTGSTVSGVSSNVSGSTSAMTGVAPAWTTASAVAMNVIAGTTTSSPWPTPSARNAIARASVPEPTPAASGTRVGGGERPLEGDQLGSFDERAGAHHAVVGRVEVGADRCVQAGKVQERDRGVVHRVRVSFLSRRARRRRVGRPRRAGVPSRRWW